MSKKENDSALVKMAKKHHKSALKEADIHNERQELRKTFSAALGVVKKGRAETFEFAEKKITDYRTDDFTTSYGPIFLTYQENPLSSQTIKVMAEFEIEGVTKERELFSLTRYPRNDGDKSVHTYIGGERAKKQKDKRTVHNAFREVVASFTHYDNPDTATGETVVFDVTHHSKGKKVKK